MFLSNTRLESVLKDVNKFMEKNQNEIIILEINNDNNSLGRMGLSAQKPIVDHLISTIISDNFILTKEFVEQPIDSYGGVFIAGSLSNYSSIIVKHSDEMTKAETPKKVVKNVFYYLDHDQFEEKEPLKFDLLATSYFVTPNNETIKTSLIYEFSES
jgi:hypothetical protein